MSFWKDYCYVDAHYEQPVTKLRTKWQRILVDQVDRRIVAKADRTNCYASVQRFKDAVALRDLIKDKEAQQKPKTKQQDPATARALELDREANELPAQQLHYHGLFFDFDCDHTKRGITEPAALLQSLTDAKKLVVHVQDLFTGLAPEHLQIWYSGRKGFHVLVRPEPFGIRPHQHLTYIIKHLAHELADTLELSTLDRTVYSMPRQWRLVNTIHPTSGRFKIELTPKELLAWTPEDIIELATHPRLGPNLTQLPVLADSMLHADAHYKDIAADPTCVAWWTQRYEQYEAWADLKNLRPRRPIIRPEDATEYPACVRDLMNNGPKPGGPNRNRVTLPIVGFFKDSGVDQFECTTQIEQWTRTWYPSEPWLSRERIPNAKSVVAQAYGPTSNVRFACRFIRSVGGPGENGRVACVGEDLCPWVGKKEDQEPAEVPQLHLSEASKGCYVGTKIKTEIHVAAMAKSPFEVPLKGRALCMPDPDAAICTMCPNNQSGGKGKLEFILEADERDVLQMINVNDNMRKSALKKKIGIPEKCFKHRIETIESGNVEEVQMIPMVDYATTYRLEEEESDDLSKKAARHVVRIAYHLGHGMEANKKYRIEATPWGHPKDQSVVFVFDTAEPAQDDIAQFKMTPDLYSKLQIFQRRPGQTVEDKMTEIHADLTANVHQIGGRADLSMAVDLCYHAVIGFRFTGQDVHKGWFELLVMGDSGTGKSSLVERMIRHYGLGELVSGEDARRTGLVYSSIQMQGQWVLQWGKVPQNDRRLLVIDEFSGIPGEEVSKLTQLRSEGRARGGGVNQAYETWARTRLIFLTNPRHNRGRLGGFNYGIQAIEDLFDEAPDIRRVDLAMVLEKDEVETSLINRRWDQSELNHVYTSGLCQALVLWAWSREPHHIRWQDGAEDEVRRWADRLGDTYDCDIPLAERADLRLKIARISAAVAARVFSTDSEAKKVLIEKEHVEFAALFMDRAYRKRSMSYFAYAKKWRQDNHFTQDRKHNIVRFLQEFDRSDDVISSLLEINQVGKKEFGDLINVEEAALKKLWMYLVDDRLLRRTAAGKWKKTVAFTNLLKDMGSAKSGYENTLPADFETKVYDRKMASAADDSHEDTLVGPDDEDVPF